MVDNIIATYAICPDCGEHTQLCDEEMRDGYVKCSGCERILFLGDPLVKIYEELE
jgi:hypothetical protein